MKTKWAESDLIVLWREQKIISKSFEWCTFSAYLYFCASHIFTIDVCGKQYVGTYALSTHATTFVYTCRGRHDRNVNYFVRKRNRLPIIVTSGCTLFVSRRACASHKCLNDDLTFLRSKFEWTEHIRRTLIPVSTKCVTMTAQ